MGRISTLALVVRRFFVPAHYQTYPNFLGGADSEEVNQVQDKPDGHPFTAVPSYLQLDSRPSSPGGGGTRCSTPTLSLIVGPVAVNPAVKELALELLKVRDRLRLSFVTQCREFRKKKFELVFLFKGVFDQCFRIIIYPERNASKTETQ